uniref:Bet v I/Major latex protein domain-containing protein n=1 Tax=Opuntia streptacantha TaxID=393608 RepID=A0A7C9ATC1_OPUST
MGIRFKLEAEVDIKSSGDLFHELLLYQLHEIPNISPEKFHAFDLHEGQFDKTGSIFYVHYTLGGKKRVAKDIIEVVEGDKLIRYKVIEGDLLDDYQSMTIGFHVIPKGEVTTVKVILEFEKKQDDGPYPTELMDFLIAMVKDIEGHHLKA